MLGAGYLLPWNALALVNAVDYFTHLYPGASIDCAFAAVYLVVMLVFLLLIVAVSHRINSYVRVNVGYSLFLAMLVAVPLIDVWYIKGRVGVYSGYYATRGLVALLGVANGLVEGSVVGNAGELPAGYMQAVCAGTAASGVIVSSLRILTKAMYPHDSHGLRQSANLYFSVSIVVMLLNIIFYNTVRRLPVIKYYSDMKSSAANEEKEQRGTLTGKLWRSTLWDTVWAVKWDWYPIILIAGYNTFDLIGKSLPSMYLIENVNVVIAASFARLLFIPLFYVCLHGPELLRTEIPVMISTCLLGLTNGYFAAVLMILAPKTVRIQHAETAGIVIVLYIVVGLATGSILSWFWVL